LASKQRVGKVEELTLGKKLLGESCRDRVGAVVRPSQPTDEVTEKSPEI